MKNTIILLAVLSMCGCISLNGMTQSREEYDAEHHKQTEPSPEEKLAKSTDAYANAVVETAKEYADADVTASEIAIASATKNYYLLVECSKAQMVLLNAEDKVRERDRQGVVDHATKHLIEVGKNLAIEAVVEERAKKANGGQK